MGGDHGRARDWRGDTFAEGDQGRMGGYRGRHCLRPVRLSADNGASHRGGGGCVVGGRLHVYLWSPIGRAWFQAPFVGARSHGRRGASAPGTLAATGNKVGEDKGGEKRIW